MKFAVLAAFAVSTGAAFVSASVLTNCCDGDGEECCSDIMPSLGDLALQYRIVYDGETCCASAGGVGCSPYGVEGCRFCKDDCNDEDNCVTCSTITSAETPSPSPTGSFPRPSTPDNNSTTFTSPTIPIAVITTDEDSDLGSVRLVDTDWHIKWGLSGNTEDDCFDYVSSYDTSHFYNDDFEVDDSRSHMDSESGSKGSNGKEGCPDGGGTSSSGGGSGHGAGDEPSSPGGGGGDESGTSISGGGGGGGSRTSSSEGGGGSGTSPRGGGGTSTPEDDGFGSEELNCNACSWDSMSTQQQRLLTERSRSLVCDSSCLTSAGHDYYGVNLCNYFNAGVGCRACCHAENIFDGCMPCEEACTVCNNKVTAICEADPCGDQCEAYICCSQRWNETSGCEDMAELATEISDECGTVWTCESPDLSCSDNPEMCVASGTFGEGIEAVDMGTCSTVTLLGGGDFDMNYVLQGAIGGELVFWSHDGVTTNPFVLQSVTMDICAADIDTSLTYGGVNLQQIFVRSNSGILAWVDGVEVSNSDGTGGEGGCTRHVWYFKDMSDTLEYVYIAVDPSTHPRYITSDWVKVPSTRDITKVDLQLVCVEQGTTGTMTDLVN